MSKFNSFKAIIFQSFSPLICGVALQWILTGNLFAAEGTTPDFSQNVVNLQIFKGESLSYYLVYKGIIAADSRMWLEDEDSLTHMIWTVKTKPLASLLFHVENRYEIVIDSQSGKLLQVHKSIDQRNIRQNWNIIYDWETLKAHADQSHEWSIVDSCTNVLVLLYQIRAKQMRLGDPITTILDVESQLWQVNGNLEASTEPGAQYKLDLVFSPIRTTQPRTWKTDLFTNRLADIGSRFTVHLSGEPPRLPLIIQFGDDLEMRLDQSATGE